MAEAEVWLDRLQGVVRGCKIGSQLFTAAGPAAVEIARKRGFRVFLDLKFHDIPNTVAGAVREATRLGVFMLNVHVSGGRGHDARGGRGGGQGRGGLRGRTTTLSRASPSSPVSTGGRSRPSCGITSSVGAHVLHLATLSREAGLDGSVASPEEIRLLRAALGRTWIIVTPGIRAVGAGDDQKRTASAADARMAGADYIVVGRPIMAAPDPVAAASRILDDLVRSG